jgi:hypothetical protein
MTAGHASGLDVCTGRSGASVAASHVSKEALGKVECVRGAAFDRFGRILKQSPYKKLEKGNVDD